MIYKLKLMALAAAVMLAVPGSYSCSSQNANNDDIVVMAVELPEGTTGIDAMRFHKDGSVEISDKRFFEGRCALILSASKDTEIYYTLDGSIPDKNSERYTDPIPMELPEDNFPTCVALRAKAYMKDGTESAVTTETFWCSELMAKEFESLVVSVTGDPEEITDPPDGIFYGKNKELRGRESEREVHLEMLDSDGSPVFVQNAGLRLFGAYSRDNPVKSMKLFARKSYDQTHGKFSCGVFGTTDAEGGMIDSYDKLVLRSAGNDFQFGFMRDELFQTIAARSGYDNCEGVVPVVVYLNGSYYGLHWLHEAVCDKLLKDKFGGDTGKYIVLEGKEQEKDVSETDSEEASAAEEFNRTYSELSSVDLTKSENYDRLCSFLDVENYLDYYAFNIIINNRDWPHNNEKCFRYYAGEGESPSGMTDGKWRFWLHDMDYSAGLYDQEETRPYYDNLGQILDPGSERYSPLFAALMKREDCRSAFTDKMHELMETTLSSESVNAAVDELRDLRTKEMCRYFDHLEELKMHDGKVWTNYGDYSKQLRRIRRFFESRNENLEKFMAKAFDPDYEEETQPAAE